MKVILNSLFLAVTLLLSSSCSEDDNNSASNDLLSIGTCGEFFNDVNVTSLCGVEANNVFGSSSGVTCGYNIAANANDIASQEFIYSVGLIQYDNISQTETIYNGLKEEYFPGEMLEPTALSGIGDEAVFGIDTEGGNQDATLLFRSRNVITVLTTEEDILDLGCNDLQQELEKLADLILEKL